MITYSAKRRPSCERHGGKSPTGVVLHVPRAVGFHIQGQGQAGAHEADHHQLVMITQDLSVLVSVGTIQIVTLSPVIVRRRFHPGPIR
jgi:hypothetical protein